MKQEIPLQNRFLDTLLKEKTPVAIYLVKGIKLQGYIENFDPDVILLKNDTTVQMIYTHSISTVYPLKENFS